MQSSSASVPSYNVVDVHYNKRRDLQTRADNMARRHASPIYCLRQFNNWLKSVLISSYCPRGAVVLDFCSGRSGDMNKLQAVGVSHVVSADFARDSLVDAAVRYNNVMSKNRHMCSYEFIHANCFEADLPAALPSTTQFDFAQCQFAIHYAFDSEQHVRRALQNVTERLKPGAFFVGTTTDSRVLIKKLRSSGELQIGNSACRVTWLGKESASGQAELDPVYGSLGIKKSDPFGYKYIFKLEDAIDGVAESLIDFDVFERIALEYGLECRLSSNFHEFFAQACNEPQFRDKLFLPNAGIFGPDGRMPADTWDVAYLYRVFVFQKVGEPQPPTPAQFAVREIFESDIRSI